MTSFQCMYLPSLCCLRILSDMDKPLPQETQQNLLRLCSIYTQSNHDDCSPNDTDASQPVYTLESLQMRLGGATQNRHAHSPDHNPSSTQAPPTLDLQEYLSAETLQERSAALRGSPWSVCTGITHTPMHICEHHGEGRIVITVSLLNMFNICIC